MKYTPEIEAAEAQAIEVATLAHFHDDPDPGAYISIVLGFLYPDDFTSRGEPVSPAHLIDAWEYAGEFIQRERLRRRLRKSERLRLEQKEAA